MFRNRLKDWATIQITWSNGNITEEKNVSMRRIGDLRNSKDVIKVEVLKHSLE